ncbi:MAG TPA: hypothetical protein VJY62_22735, partial [Bacteroidia bacterium]|nr:hypothetical protein [Bacteroidia bacterium]
NNNSSEDDNGGKGITPAVKKVQPAEKSLNENKSVFANNVNVEKKEKKLHQKKNHDEKTLVGKKMNAVEINEIIIPVERKEIAQIETSASGGLQQQIVYINIDLLKQELNNSTALNSYLDRVTDPDSKNNFVNPQTSITQNKQQKPLLSFFAWALSAFSKKDVMLKKSYNAEGEMVAYQLESGKFKIGKSSSR